MKWAIKHKSGRTLFVTSDEFIANNRRDMGWIVEEMKMTSREQFEESWLRRGGESSDLIRYPENHHEIGSGNIGGQYVMDDVQVHWQTWQASRAAIEIATPWLCGDGDNDTEWTEGYNDGVMATEKAIKQAGLKVKK